MGPCWSLGIANLPSNPSTLCISYTYLAHIHTRTLTVVLFPVAVYGLQHQLCGFANIAGTSDCSVQQFDAVLSVADGGHICSPIDVFEEEQEIQVLPKQTVKAKCHAISHHRLTYNTVQKKLIQWKNKFYIYIYSNYEKNNCCYVTFVIANIKHWQIIIHVSFEKHKTYNNLYSLYYLTQVSAPHRAHSLLQINEFVSGPSYGRKEMQF